MFKRSAFSIYKKMGFKTDSQGIMKRYLVEKNNWAKHLENTKQFILKSAATKRKGTAVILGTGWLLDVPADELLTIFDTIYFVDIVHPEQIKHKYRHSKNLHFIETDITGIAKNLYLASRNFKKTGKINLLSLLPSWENFGLAKGLSIDFCVSVNMLNQLDILLIEYLSPFKLYSKNELDAFRKSIQQQHINTMPVGQSCLCTDFIEISSPFDNSETATKKLVFANLPKANFSAQWDWHFDLNGNYHKEKKTVFKVYGIDF